MTSVVVFGYIFPKTGAEGSSFGPHMLARTVASHAFFRTVWKAMIPSADMQHNRLSAQLVMPLSVGYILATKAISWAVWDALLMILGLVVGKIFLLGDFPLAEVNWWKAVPMLITINLFYGFFSVWIASLLGGMVSSAWIYPRVVNPMFMFGCVYYSFKQVEIKNEIASYLIGLNPITYCVEGLRSSMLSPEKYLGVGVCIAVLWTYIALFFWHSIVRFKKKFDLY